MNFDELEEDDSDFDLGDVLGETPISELGPEDLEDDDPGFEDSDPDCGSGDEEYPWNDDADPWNYAPDADFETGEEDNDE